MNSVEGYWVLYAFKNLFIYFLVVGFVHLWHLSSSSPFVRLASYTLAPVRCFLAHDVGVMSLSWSWGDATYFVTGSLDNLVKVWDAQDTRAPLSSIPGTESFLTNENCTVLSQYTSDPCMFEVSVVCYTSVVTACRYTSFSEQWQTVLKAVKGKYSLCQKN